MGGDKNIHANSSYNPIIDSPNTTSSGQNPMYDANTLTQNEIVNLQSEELAKLNAQWESLMAQEAESKKEQNYNNEYTLGQELALGLLGNRTHKNQQEKPMTRLFNALTGSLLDNNISAYGRNLFDDGGKYYYKSKDAGYIMPEIAVTPNGNYAAAPLGNGDYGVTAGTLNYMGVPIY